MVARRGQSAPAAPPETTSALGELVSPAAAKVSGVTSKVPGWTGVSAATAGSSVTTSSSAGSDAHDWVWVRRALPVTTARGLNETAAPDARASRTVGSSWPKSR